MEMTGRREPSPTITEEGVVREGVEVFDRVPAFEVMWEVAPVSKYQPIFWGGVRDTVLKAEARDWAPNMEWPAIPGCRREPGKYLPAERRSAGCAAVGRLPVLVECHEHTVGSGGPAVHGVGRWRPEQRR